MAASVRMEQGATTMPLARNEPLAMLAPMWSMLCTTSARAGACVRSRPSSWVMLSQPASEMTAWVSMPGSVRSACSRRTP